MVTRIDQDHNIDLIKDEVGWFSNKIVDGITRNEKMCINQFYKKRKFQPELLKLKDVNPDIKNHPAIRWALIR
jgi:hypothetical protein